jgi:hypothetical protein
MLMTSAKLETADTAKGIPAGADDPSPTRQVCGSLFLVREGTEPLTHGFSVDQDLHPVTFRPDRLGQPARNHCQQRAGKSRTDDDNIKSVAQIFSP